MSSRSRGQHRNTEKRIPLTPRRRGGCKQGQLQPFLPVAAAWRSDDERSDDGEEEEEEEQQEMESRSRRTSRLIRFAPIPVHHSIKEASVCTVCVCDGECVWSNTRKALVSKCN